MINFTIPGTGSSGHLGGGMILAILLGPHAAFLVMASVLTVQALFFADGGLLALGCNIWNLGVYPCYLIYPLIYKPLVGRRQKPRAHPRRIRRERRCWPCNSAPFRSSWRRSSREKANCPSAPSSL